MNESLRRYQKTDAYREYHREWQKNYRANMTEEQKRVEAEKIKERRKRYEMNQNNKLKIKARNAVARALRGEKIVREKCIICGDSKTQAHHHKGYSYENRLDVQWFCRIHHEMEHRKGKKN